MTDRGKRKVLGPPELPVIDPGYCEEASFTSSKDDLVLYLKRWIPTKAISPSEPPRALVAFCHGFIEHYGRYENIFKLFAQANIAVTAFDQRGFGRTWSKAPNPNKAHGNTTWKQQFKDIEDFIRLERARTDAKYGKDRVPIYLMGHSMGGGLACGFFTRPVDSNEDPSAEVKDMIKGVICSSPWLKLTKPPATILTFILPLILKLFPECPFYQDVNPNDLTHDKDVIEWSKADPLCDGRIHLKCLPGPLFGGAKIVDEEYKNWPRDLPLLVLHGSDDLVTSSEAGKSFIDRIDCRDKEHKLFTGLYHECWHELGDIKITFIKHIIDWIIART